MDLVQGAVLSQHLCKHPGHQSPKVSGSGVRGWGSGTWRFRVIPQSLTGTSTPIMTMFGPGGPIIRLYRHGLYVFQDSSTQSQPP